MGILAEDRSAAPPAPGTTESNAAGRTATSLAALSSRFARDERGTVAMVFGLMVVPCIMLVGFAVDFGRIISVRAQTQNVVDNAALAAGKSVQTTSGNYLLAATEAATKYWSGHKGQVGHVVSSSATPQVTSDVAQTRFEVSVDVWVPTPFMTASMLIANKAAETGAPTACASSGWQCQKMTVKSEVLLKAGGSNTDKDVEIAMMLDVTGSMSGQKIVDLKLAAKDLVDIVVWQDQSRVKSRVALVPFAQAVYVGATVSPAVRGNLTPGTCNNNTPGCEFFTFNKAGGGSNDWRTYKVNNACAIARTGNDKWTDEAPNVSPLPKPYFDSNGGCGLVDTSDPEINLVTPLSNDKVMLKNRIDKMKLSGSTAGHIGTAWAWYMLSPKWGYLYPTANRAAAYDATKTQKIAILMTDGEYNTQYCKGVEASDSLSPKINCAGDGGDSEQMASHLCEDMKAAGITVYTVGFQAPTAAKNMLKDCATTESHYYDTTTGEALRMAFRDIALKVSSLIVSK